MSLAEETFVPRRRGIMQEKIHRQHRERLAIVYIGQSTPEQVERHQESTRLQYALVHRAIGFGWARETVAVMDDDLGGDRARPLKAALVFSDWSRRLVSPTSDWFLALRCRAWRDRAGTGFSC
jgi:hypothetical protein